MDLIWLRLLLEARNNFNRAAIVLRPVFIILLIDRFEGRIGARIFAASLGLIELLEIPQVALLLWAAPR